MEQLTGLDAAFLALETPSSTGHVGGVSILDPSSAPVPLDLARITQVIEERLPLVPVMRRRLQSVPLGLDQPYWVDDPDFDIEYHVRELALPRPGSLAQLTEQVSRIHARPLDKSRPLWETYFITGLAKRRVALYTKVHHAAFDGVSGAELVTVLMDLSPQGRDLPPAEPFDPPAPPGRVELVARTAGGLLRRPLQATRMATNAVRAVPSLAPALGPLVASLGMGRRGSDGGLLKGARMTAPPTPFNESISQHRKLGLVSVPLGEVKEVKTAFGVSVNDVVMAMCAGVLRTWLLEHGALPEDPLVAMVPVSVRDPKAHASGGNRVSAMLAALPTDVDDPVERLVRVHEATQLAKSQQAAIPQGLVDDISDFAPPVFMTRAARVVFGSHLLNRLPPFNLVISNVPGPNIPVYMAGAKLLAHYPVSIVTDGVGLNITLIGYLGELHFGVIAAREIVPDVDVMTARLRDELDLLLAEARRLGA